MKVRPVFANLPRIALLMLVFAIGNQIPCAMAQQPSADAQQPSTDPQNTSAQDRSEVSQLQQRTQQLQQGDSPRNIPSFGEPRDGYIHMTYRRLENSFNANAQQRGLPIRLVEQPQPGLGHDWNVSSALLIHADEDITRKSLAHIVIEGFVRTKKHRRLDRPPFDWQTFLQYLDCFVQTVEPQLTTQERTAVMARTGLLRFPDPLQFPPYFLRFDHNSIEYSVLCKRDRNERTEAMFNIIIKGCSADPVDPPPTPPTEDIQVVPGATKHE